jgi:hypothetical protein
MSLLMGQFMDGQALHESGNRYVYFDAGTDGVPETADDLLGRFSIRRYNWQNWSADCFGEERDWKLPQNQDMVVMHLLEGLFTTYRLKFVNESAVQIWQRLAAWWKFPVHGNDPNPTATWSSGLKAYVRKAGEAINSLGYEGWTAGEGWV